jgi:hypothetical protein
MFPLNRTKTISIRVVEQLSQSGSKSSRETPNCGQFAINWRTASRAFAPP